MTELVDINLYLPPAVLNSDTVSEWVLSTQSYFDRWRLQKISISELRTLPIPYHVTRELAFESRDEAVGLAQATLGMGTRFRVMIVEAERAEESSRIAV